MSRSLELCLDSSVSFLLVMLRCFATLIAYGLPTTTLGLIKHGLVAIFLKKYALCLNETDESFMADGVTL